MVWGCVAWPDIGNLARIEDVITAGEYIDILRENLEESLLKLQNNFIFQQDNDPKRKTKKTIF